MYYLTENPCVLVKDMMNIISILMHYFFFMIPGYCRPPNHYLFESRFQFWYKYVERPQQAAPEAIDACKLDCSYLLLIDNGDIFDFTVDLLGTKRNMDFLICF